MSNYNLTINDSDDDEIEIHRNSPYEFNLQQNKGVNIMNDNSLFNKAHISHEVLSSRSSASSVSSTDNDENKNRTNILMSSGEEDTTDSSQSSKIVRKESKKKHYNNDTSDINQKKEILYQFDRLKSKGINVPYSFNMNSDLEEMRIAYDRIKREKDIDASIKFQRKVMMGFITGTEYVNSRYDPFGVFLEGFSEQIHGELDEYDPIFEELHEKYEMSESKMAPELRLMVSLGGSAFMYHLTSKMFSNEKLPKVEEVLKNNPELMKQFQHAAADTYMGKPPPQQSNPLGGLMGGGGNDIFSMVSGLFGNMQSEPMNEVDNIINSVHNNISVMPNNENDMVETMTVSDAEITSIIEDTADLNILLGNKKKPRKKKATGRTLDL